MSHEVISIRDDGTGAHAAIMPTLGFNCCRFEVPIENRIVSTIWSEPEFQEGSCRSTGSGIPLLFPFPGRLAGTTLEWEGKIFELEPGDGQGNAIHGFVHQRPWRVLDSDASHVTGQFHASQDDPRLLEQWPSDFRITATYSISGTSLEGVYVLENPGSTPLPCGFGAHPYFSLPLAGSDAANCRVRLPVAAGWELVDMLATGGKQFLTDAVDLQNGKPFAELELDNVFADLVYANDRCVATIEEPGSGYGLELTFGRPFRECVVYTPPHRQAICIEPYTCVPGAMQLVANGIDTGLITLQAGESIKLWMSIRLFSHDTV